MLQKPEIMALVVKHRKARIKRTNIDADFVLNQLAQFQDALISEIVDARGHLLDVQEWPIHWQRMVNGIEIEEIFEGSGKDRVWIGYLKKVKLMDRAKIMEMIGKHVDVGAFADRKIIEDKRSFVDVLNARKKRAAALHDEESVH